MTRGWRSGGKRRADGHQTGDRRVAGQGQDDRRLPRQPGTSSRPPSATSASCRRNAADVPAEYKGQPWARLGVDVDNDFEPLYVVSADRKQQVSKLKALVKDADEIYLATDEDREGEAIAWHLVETLKPKIPVAPHGLPRDHPERDRRRRGQPARDRRRPRRRAGDPAASSTGSYGYEVSPVLWKKVLPGLSAGRVQSVATRMVVENERERMAFRAASYWDVVGTFAPQQPKPGDPETFTATLVSVDDTRLATGRDFDAADRPRARPTSLHLDEAGARGLAARLEGRAFTVQGVEEKPYRRRPYAPFMTSTLQQEAGRKFRWSAQQVMRTAQRLYENGYITYMRTDSTNLSETALTAARTQARELYGDAYVPAEPRIYTRKVKNAQEAHEAIRPAGDSFRTPGPGRQRAVLRRVPALRADLAAHARLADGRRRRHHGVDPHRRRRRRRTRPSCSRPAGAPSRSPASCAPTSRTPTRPRPRRTTPRSGCRS